MLVQAELIGGVNVEDHTPNHVFRLAGEERIGLRRAIAAPLVKAERMVEEPRDADRIGRGHALPQAAGAHVRAIGEVEHIGIVRRRSSRKVKEKLKKSSNVYIKEGGIGLWPVFAGFRYSG